ncbi:MAG TPA: serine/threonine-protein kinase [Gemmatimonadales bacterium]|nr:serine/threonine-protein kinase [Gemmatimonadales bacterium]
MPPEEPTVISGGAAQPAPPPLAAPTPSGHPARIGPYRIVRVLGQGGMGTVYEAEQLEPIRRTVALKVIRRGMDTAEVLGRFASERQALAVMDHPNIAHALEAGTTDEGLPYFVMELVPGEPITDYCDRHGLDLRRRLQLLLGVCRGVQHAHQKGVIHRDLKPSNILVRVVDGQPVPTIIDFGIAKAIEATGDSAFTTELGVQVGTPLYMSPEQAEASKLDIDTRADIYSLGMVLYELVTGVLPFEYKGLLPARFITEYVLGTSDTPTPSRRVASLAADTASSAAERRHTTPVGLRRELRGDLDWIVMKAIERDRNRRYETANALALDLERHLDHKPVTARPPTLAYTTAKFVRRNRLGVSVLATAVVALTAGIIGITRERDRSAQEAAKARAISGFLVDLLKSADPWQGGGRQTTVVDALAEGVKQVNAGRVKDPAVAASVRRTIGTAYQGLGRLAEADTLFRETLRERIARTGPASEETAESWNDLGNLLTAVGKLDSAEAALGHALAIRRGNGGADTLIAGTLLDLADLANAKGEAARGDSLAHQALDILRRVVGERDLAVAAAMGRVQSTQLGAGELEKAESTGRAAAAMLQELGLDRHPQMVPILSDLSITLANRGEMTEALATARRTVALDTLLFGTAHPYLATHLENLGYVYDHAGFGDSAKMMVRQVLAMRRALLADDNPAIGRTLFNLASLEYNARSYRAAEPLFEEALLRMRRAYGPEHPDVVYATGSMGRNQYYLGRAAEAERNLRWALGVRDASGRVDPTDSVRFGRILVPLMVEQRRWKEAEPLALRVFAIQDSLKDTLARVTAADLAKIYDATGQRERAESYRARVLAGGR